MMPVVGGGGHLHDARGAAPLHRHDLRMRIGAIVRIGLGRTGDWLGRWAGGQRRWRDIGRELVGQRGRRVRRHASSDPDDRAPEAVLLHVDGDVLVHFPRQQNPVVRCFEQAMNIGQM
jgi:hypothetical protein